jgi:hypothetical protein
MGLTFGFLAAIIRNLNKKFVTENLLTQKNSIRLLWIVTECDGEFVVKCEVQY